MKEIKILFAALLAVAYVNVLHAQDLNSAIEAYNLGATAAQEGNYISAIDNLNRALDLANVLGEEGCLLLKTVKILFLNCICDTPKNWPQADKVRNHFLFWIKRQKRPWPLDKEALQKK